MKTLTFTVTDKYCGKYVRDVLKNQFKLSSNIITKLKKEPLGIQLNGMHATVAKKLTVGDVVTINICDRASQNIEPVKMDLNILYEDEDILCVNKAPNVPTHPSLKHYNDTLANGVMYYYKDTHFTFRAITRLDRETSGIVLIAKNALSAKILSEQMAEGKIIKEYMAITDKKPKSEKGTINAPIKRKEESCILRCVAPDGKISITDYEVMRSDNGFYLIKAMPKTGRTHQIRVHLASIGSPIYADGLYGEEIKGERLRLHCCSLKFMHPSNKKEITITAPLPEDFNILL